MSAEVFVGGLLIGLEVILLAYLFFASSVPVPNPPLQSSNSLIGWFQRMTGVPRLYVRMPQALQIQAHYIQVPCFYLQSHVSSTGFAQL